MHFKTLVYSLFFLLELEHPVMIQIIKPVAHFGAQYISVSTDMIAFLLHNCNQNFEDEEGEAGRATCQHRTKSLGRSRLNLGVRKAFTS